ncbi:MAG: AAA family ATPase, partial [Candidatus Vecturithrix sp.]|nr:AAA family ATPase [Candidatus Vecturithrix sp.]
MDQKPDSVESKSYWFVGATFDRTDDQTQRFLKDGIWEIKNPSDKDSALVRSMQVGDQIAIKSTYVRKHKLPFDNHGNPVSVMAIKAFGKIKKNNHDGLTVLVDWSAVSPPREWYFYTYRSTIWRVLPDEWETDGLIRFAFEGKEQDIDRFRNAPYWRERFGDSAEAKSRFKWTRFYEAVADKLLTFRERRSELIFGIHAIANKVDGLSNLQDQFRDGSSGPLKDICPFTTMGIFNRGISDVNRKAIASELARLLEVSDPVPDSFEGVPILNNQKSWLFGFDNKRQPDDIETLWEIFAQAIAFAELDDAEARSAFVSAYDNATQRYGVGWNLTMGLYWIRPWTFPTLDGQSQRYISKKLNIQIGMNGPKGRCNATDYLAVLDTLEARFQEDAYPVHSFPELSLAAWLFKDSGPSAHPNATDPDTQDDEADDISEAEVMAAPIEPYSVDDILTDGCFIAREKLEKILERLRTKKNLILQGPPGT